MEGTDDDVVIEECDEGADNGLEYYGTCTTTCKNVRCGDGVTQKWRGEECDAGDANGNVDLVNGGCKLGCMLPECSNGRDQADIADGGTENVADGLADENDGGCYEKVCNFDSQYLKGKDSESNPCLVQRPGGTPSSRAATVSLGGSCQDSSECQGYQSGSNGRIFCMSEGGGSYGTCTDVGADSGLASRENGLVEVAYAAGGFNPPICVPGVCGFVVGDEAQCGGAFRAEGETCDAQRQRQQCLFNSAVAQNHCPGGVLVPVHAGGQASCLEGQAPNQQKMCGPTGQWFCMCPGDNVNPWQEQLMACGPKCGDKIRDAGEACDDGNLVAGDGCSPTCTVEPGNQCDPNACAGGGAPVCQNGEVCQVMDQLPCLQCAQPIGGQCTGRECAEGGDAAAAAQGMECSLIPNFPCVTFIPRNSCGNGEINTVPPQRVDEGCAVTGTSGQYCMAENAVIDDFGAFQPNHQCFQNAHCKNTNGQCEWEMTAGLEQCLNESAEGGGGLPPGCTCNGDRLMPGCPVDFVRNPCVPLGGVQAALQPSALTAQVAPPSNPIACTRDMKRCCENGVMRFVGRDPATCEFPSCTEDLSQCAPTCESAGCNGELCVLAGTAPPAANCSVSPAAACYAQATCELVGSSCAWRQTPQLQQCLTNNAGGTCATDQSCLSRSACTQQGGSAGVSCGADGTNVCCGGVITDQPVEECDDGNRVDGDACGNDCRINCTSNAQCPEGACVEGQCVDQCVAPQPAAPLAHAAAPSWAEYFSRLLPREGAEFSLLP